MEPAKVYFSDLRADEISTLEKLHRLMKAAGFEQIDFKDKYVAIKLHFGEPGNMAYLRPNWARVVCDYVRELGGKPFLTDCNTLYVGGRANALDHLDSAMRNGYSPMTTGAQCIIADGLKGEDYDLVPIRGGKYLRAAKIGRAIMDADIFISLTHAKGHVSAGFGGALKNIGMGCGSRAGKEEMHSSGKPVVDQDKCIGCGKCVENCAHNGPHIENGKCTILKYKWHRLRPLHQRLPDARHPCGLCDRKRAAQLQDRRVCQGGRRRPSVVPHRARARRVALLRLPQFQRRADRAECGHVRVLRPVALDHLPAPT